jgi:cholesterol transport system auxiliary component
MTLTRRFIVLGLGVTLAGCGKLVDLPGQGPGADLYDLRGAVPAFATNPAKPLSVQVVVMEPVADRSLDTDRIAVQPGQRRIDYFAAAKWSDRAPALIQGLLLASLQHGGRLPASSRPGGLSAQVSLGGDLESFEVHGTDQPEVKIALRLRLVAQPSGKLIDARLFEKSAPASGRDVTAVTAAFEAALAPILHDAADWTVMRLEGLAP